MWCAVASADVQDYIFSHEHDDPRAMVLKQPTLFGIPSPVIADQLAGRRKARIKLPTFYRTRGIVYPPGINLEQSSSEATAAYKCDVLQKEGAGTGTLVDLTGGFGVDTWFFSRVFGQVHWVEPNEALRTVVEHNHRLLESGTVHYHTATAEEFCRRSTPRADVVYIDPSRRKASEKVFRLAEGVPDVVSLAPELLQRADCILVKSAPLLDIQQACRELPGVTKVWVVSVNNDCKELLFLCRTGAPSAPTIVAANILQHHVEEFSFTMDAERAATVAIGEPGAYVYEPNASILKAGAFKMVGPIYDVAKLHANTHLYTSERANLDFPGRIFAIERFVSSSAKEIRSFFPEGKANVITRNYPLSAVALRQKLGLQDGGEGFVIGFTGATKKYLAVARRIK